MLVISRINGLHFIGAFMLCILAMVIWSFYRDWVNRRKVKQLLLTLEDRLEAAHYNFARLTNFNKYFPFYDEQQFLGSFKELRQQIKPGFERLGLREPYLGKIKNFIANFDCIASIRKQYNEDFVKKETAVYRNFFDSLEDYPLSADQAEAIVRDEDNNLVIAGAGTGKTTTISGKVAYLLEKGLARPEELLIISFTKNAVNEMYERCLRFCRNIPNIDKLDVRTFNSFGYLVKRHCAVNELHLAFDGDDQLAKAFLQETFDRLFITDSNFQKKAVNFIAFFNRPERDEFSFSTKNDFIKHEKSFKNETLDGQKMNSKEEVQIGNFLCLFGVNYEYQKHYPLQPEDRNDGHSAYHPDFYLTDYEIWYEHFGINREGNVPSWFNTKPPFATAKDYYHAGINWKRTIHKKYGTKLIETYSYENAEGRLITNLKNRLIDQGVVLKQRTPEELLSLVKKSVHYEDFINLIYTFLGLMKSNAGTPADLLGNKGDKRLSVFMDVFKPLYQRYEGHLTTKSQIDYNDMVNQAAGHFLNGDFTKPYKYILVDEFQDMSLGRYALLKSIRQQNPAVKLYAVGDDWQSIFRFTGSDISIITTFEKHFGFTSQTSILRTYRFNDQILKASSDFVQKNPTQIRKSLLSDRQATFDSFAFVGSNVSGSREAHQHAKESKIRSALSEILALNRNATVYLIGRYHHNRPLNYRAITRDYSTLKIEYFTAHRVKGMTCDYAVLLDVDSGTLGFPSEIADDPLLNYLLHEGDSFENAEERRVFYVAITRARHKNYLLYNAVTPSKFLLEIMTSSASQNSIIEKCPECQGILVKRKGPYSEFLGCSNYPGCNGRLPLASIQKFNEL